MSLTELEKWEMTLRQALDGVDVQLERKYGEQIARRVQRPAAGETASPRFDGLFALNAAFSLGLANGLGPGYVITLQISSASPVCGTLKEQILADVAAMVPDALATAFPGRTFRLVRQSDRFHLSGDLRL